MKIRWQGALLALAVSSLAGCGAKKVTVDALESTGPKAITVTVAKVETRPVVRTVEVVGTLKGWEEVTVGNKRMGRVLKIYHDMGDRVQPGEPLVELDPVDMDLTVRQALRSLRAQLEQVGLHDIPSGKFDESTVPSVVQARFVLEKSQQNLNREKSLRQRGAGTQQDYQNAEIDEHSAEAAYKNAQLNARAILATAMVNKVMLDVVEQQRADMTIRAPIPSRPLEGTKANANYAITKRSVSEGQMLKESDSVIQLVIDNPLRLLVNVPERFSNEVTIGEDAKISISAFPDKDFIGKVTRINPSVDPVSRTFQVEAVVPNDDGKLRPGGFAKASIVIKRNDASLTVPRACMVTAGAINKLFVVNDDQNAKEIHFTPGQGEKDWIEVIAPTPSISAGSKVVLEGHSKLFDGHPVIILDQNAPKANSTSDSQPKPTKASG